MFGNCGCPGRHRTEKELDKEKRMGNGSPRLHGHLRAFALPFAIVAGLVGAPAAYADLTSVVPPTDAVAPVAATVVETVQQAVTAAPVDVPETIDQTAAPARGTASSLEQSLPPAVTHVRETVEPVISSVSHIVVKPVQMLTFSSSTPTAKRTHARPSAPTRPQRHAPSSVRAFAPQSHITHIASPARVTGWTQVPRADAARMPQLSDVLAFRLNARPTTRGGIDLSAGGSASGVAAGIVLLLLALAAELGACCAPSRFRRLRPSLGALRPTPLLLHLERPD
jgi:hypothetical protein